MSRRTGIPASTISTKVPTWNYRVVHVHGKLYIRDNERFVRGVVARLTRTHEAQTGSPRPWKMTDSSPEYIDQMLSAIVGIEVEVTRMVGKWKLSQNKEERDRSTWLIPSSFQDETNYGMLESVDIDGGIAWPDRGG
jgi:predicted FMN-binding regulatory protein PaiB